MNSEASSTVIVERSLHPTTTNEMMDLVNCLAGCEVRNPDEDDVMFMKVKGSEDLIRVESMPQLCDPMSASVIGHRQSGEEEQDREEFQKSDLVFPSGESLPRCWKDEQYQLSRAERAMKQFG